MVDLLCAYADGELAEHNIQLVEDHLAICENCSAILKVYKEISNSIDDTNVPAPDALRIGIMNRIQSENTPRKTDTDKLRRSYRMILARFVPVAACLVVMLLVWQFWGDLFGSPHQQDTTSPLAAPADSAPAAAPEYAFNLDEAKPEIAMESAGGVQSFTDDALTDDPGNRRLIPQASGTAEETEQIIAYINGAYAKITIIGEFPAILGEFDPLPFGSWDGWEMVIEIPAADVQVFLEELLCDCECTAVVYNMESSNSTYAVIFYSPG